MTKEQSALTKVMKAFAREEMLLEHSAFSYRISNKLAIEGDGKGLKDRNEYKEFERERAIMKYFDCKFIKIGPDEKYFDMYVEIGKICNHVDKPSKKPFKEIIRIKI